MLLSLIGVILPCLRGLCISIGREKTAVVWILISWKKCSLIQSCWQHVVSRELGKTLIPFLIGWFTRALFDFMVQIWNGHEVFQPMNNYAPHGWAFQSLYQRTWSSGGHKCEKLPSNQLTIPPCSTFLWVAGAMLKGMYLDYESLNLQNAPQWIFFLAATTIQGHKLLIKYGLLILVSTNDSYCWRLIFRIPHMKPLRITQTCTKVG